MDQDTQEIVAQLATRLGMAFEDAAPVALMLGSASDTERALAVADLGEALVRAGALHAAIVALTG